MVKIMFAKPKLYLCSIGVSFLFAAGCLGQTISGESHAADGAGAPPAASANLFGVTKGPEGVPLAGVRVVIHNLDDGSERVLESDTLGAYAATDLKPGRYHLTANKDRLVSPPDANFELAANQNLRNDISLSVGSDVPVTATTQSKGGFFKRFFQYYADDWKPADPNAPAAPAPKYRSFEAPVDGPPYPFSVWPYGGSVVIGQPWTQSGPLMNAIWGGSNGDWWKNSGIQIYGWLNAGANVSTSKGGGYSNFPEAYAERQGFELDQEVLYIERQPDTVQTDHVDWGFRISALYGLDYRFTTSNGFFSDQLLTKNRENGFDMPMFYFDLYVPQVAQGMDIRVGRYISLPDIEAQLAPNNYTYSHSLLYTFDCYTQLGMNATIKLSDHWMVQAGISPGCDTMPWTSSAKVTLNACLGYTWTQGRDNIYVCDNSLNNGHYAYNNLQAFYATWYHKYGKDSRWHSSTETWYQYEKDTPNINNPAAQSLLINGANGAICNNIEALTCLAPDYAVVNYQEYQMSKHDYLSFRNEFFDDFVGQRTGTKSKYTEHLLGWGHWVGTTVLFRPELRWEHSYDAPAYDNGTRHSQLTFASDVILFF
jgi:Putative beta-barrel porin-2, OmpL-like. bbp2/Carboxypeptidase regulatory-like domain